MYSGGPGPPAPHYQQQSSYHQQQPYDQPPYQHGQYGPPPSHHGQYPNNNSHHSGSYRGKRGRGNYGGSRQYHQSYSGQPDAPPPHNYQQGQYQQPPHYNQQYYPPQHQQRPPDYPPQQHYQQPPHYSPPSSYPPQQGYPPQQQYGPPPNAPPPPQQYPPSAPSYHQPYPPPNHQHPQGYPPQGYSPPQDYSAPAPQSYPPPPQHQYPPQNQPPPPSQGYAPPQSYQQYQRQPQGSHHGQYSQAPPPQESRYHRANGQNSGPHSVPPSGGAHYSQHNHQQNENYHRKHSSYRPNEQASTNDTRAESSDAGDGQSQERQSFYSAVDDWGFDFDGALWPKGNDAVDPQYSIGIIIWHPAKQVTRALPSTFDEAEEQATKPPAKPLENGESVSVFFTLQNSHEAFLDVRQTDDWPNVEHDSIFYEFPAKCELIPLKEVITARNRPNFTSDHGPKDDTMEDGEVSERGSDWNVMDHLEEALGGSGPEKGIQPAPKSRDSPSRSQILAPSRLQTEQEELLARLGVDGSPKPIQPGPIAVYPVNDEPKSRLEAPIKFREYDPQLPRASSTAPPPPSPPPSKGRDSRSPNPWGVDESLRKDAANTSYSHRTSPGPSEGSQHTLAGSDFYAEAIDNDEKSAPVDDPKKEMPSANAESTVSRKRSHGDTEAWSDGTARQSDETTPRTSKRRLPQVDAAYNRRW